MQRKKGYISGRELRCLFCQYDEFYEHKVVITKSGFSLFNESGYGFQCCRCGFLCTFIKPSFGPAQDY